MFHPIKLGYHRYRLTLLFTALVTFTSLGFVSDLSVDLSNRTLYNPDSGDARVYQSVVSEFGSDEIALVITKDSALFTPTKLSHLERLQSKLERISGVEKVDRVS